MEPVRNGPEDSPRIQARIGRDGRLIDLQAEPTEGGEWDLTLEFSAVGDQLFPSRLEIEPGIFSDGIPPGGITARLLHAIRVGELVDEFNRGQRRALAAEELFFGRSRPPDTWLPPPANRPGPRGLGQEFYQDVARYYLEALQTDPRRPIERMSERYPGCSRANVRDWVSHARESGYLTTLGRGRPGGQPTQKLLEALRARHDRPGKAGSKKRRPRRRS